LKRKWKNMGGIKRRGLDMGKGNRKDGGLGGPKKKSKEKRENPQGKKTE